VIEIVATGPLATVQDLGRAGWAHLAVSPSGAADLGSLRLANRLVGNPDRAAGIEATLGGLAVRAHGPTVVAVTGAPVVVARNGTSVGMGCAIHLRAGDELALGVPGTGLRCYLAVRGGVDVAPQLGSRSTDVLGRLGPPPLAVGQRLALGPDPGRLPAPDQVPLRQPVDPAVLRVRLGPRDDWFSERARATLAGATWRVRSESDRVGVRLDGPALERRRPGELASEGLVSGAVQVPPDGRPLLFLADHPTTGGYPVIAVVLSPDRDGVGQLRPGQAVRFAVVG
jgi:biotin-dependent carboxylase-like uncharacterized protein